MLLLDDHSLASFMYSGKKLLQHVKVNALMPKIWEAIRWSFPSHDDVHLRHLLLKQKLAFLKYMVEKAKRDVKLHLSEQHPGHRSAFDIFERYRYRKRTFQQMDKLSGTTPADTERSRKHRALLLKNYEMRVKWDKYVD